MPTLTEQVRKGESGEGVFPSLEAALAAAPPGAVVTLCAGTYAECAVLRDVELQAEEDGVVIEGRGFPTLTCVAGDVKLKGLTVRQLSAGPFPALLLAGGSLAAADCAFEAAKFTPPPLTR